jgi:hypothetical protein
VPGRPATRDASLGRSYQRRPDALIQFGTITDLDPASLGADEIAARDLGISAADAATLQRIASLELGFQAQVPEPGSLALVLGGIGLAGLGTRRRATAS